jgi:hypothetical protein
VVADRGIRLEHQSVLYDLPSDDGPSDDWGPGAVPGSR